MKIIRVECCEDCPYKEYWGMGVVDDCTYSARRPIKKPKKTKLPDWCPLEDSLTLLKGLRHEDCKD